MMQSHVVKTTCTLCVVPACGVLATVENGKVVEIRGDPDDPKTKGVLCEKGLASLEYLYHPERLKHPLKRVGKRGEGKWERLSWDEALSEVADELNGVKQRYGPESVAMAHGSAKGYQDTHLLRLANAFGTPNVACADHVCYIPRLLGAEYTFGFMPGCDYGHSPACITIWGTNPVETRSWVYRAIMMDTEKGTRLVVIDPFRSNLAKVADLWVQVRPGSDLALALAMQNVIINEGLYDKEFVEKWTVGFDKLKAHVQPYSPERMAEITWVDAGTIRELTELYATSRPGIIDWGNALDLTLNSFQAGRAIASLMALTGNLAVQGGQIETAGSGFRYADTEPIGNGMLGRWSSKLEFRDKLPIQKRQNKVGAELTLLPDFRYVLPQAVTKAVLEGKPYPIRAIYLQSCNALSSWPNIREVYNGLKRVAFLVVSDMFMTPTAALADIVLPAATYLEYDGVVLPPNSFVAKVQRKVAQIGEARSDHEIISDMACKLGLDLGDSGDGFWDAILKPVGVTFREFEKMDGFSGSGPGYRAYEENGFKTPSGKVEFYSKQLEDMGVDPMPAYRELPETPQTDPDLAKEYPLFCTTRKLAPFRHSGGRQISSLREDHSEPVVLINPETASQLGVTDGDWVSVETKRGEIKQRANLSTDVDPRVVVIDHAWWYPEKGETELFGWAESNDNVLTNNRGPFAAEVGSVHIIGFLCKVCKVSK